METKTENTKITQKKMSKEMGVSDSTIKRYRNDIKMDSPYNRKNLKKKTSQRHSTTQSHVKKGLG